MRTKQYFGSLLIVGLAIFASFAGGCADQPLPAPGALVCPTPISGNGGKYMSPSTSDGVLAKWVDKAVAAKGASEVGGAIGSAAAGYALRQVPFVGGFIGDQVGQEIGKDAAIAAAGGNDYIKKSSDLSFNDIQSLAVYMYVTLSARQDFEQVRDAVGTIYPEFNNNYESAIRSAPLKPVQAPAVTASQGQSAVASASGNGR